MSTKKRVLVCGANGFIGRNIFERLASRIDIEFTGTYNTNRFNNDQRLRHANLTREDMVNQLLEGVDAVIVASAMTTGSRDVKERPYIHVTDNNIMNQLLIRMAFEKNVSQLIYFGCSVPYSSSDILRRWLDENLH